MLYPYTLGIVAIMKNEAPYVKEWLDYHLNAGVDVVFLYDNNSDDNLEEILSPYIEEGSVIYQKFPGNVPQLRAYHDALLKYRFLCKYMAFIDADEFIYPTNNKSIKDFIEKFFYGKDNLSILYVYWLFFGSNGEKNENLSKNVLERFKKRGKSANEYGKSIVNPRLIWDYITTPHTPIPLGNTMVLDENENNPLTAKIFPTENIFIAHYAAKSKEEYIKRHLKRPDGFFKTAPQINADGSFNDEKFKEVDQNEIIDTRILEYYNLNKNNRKSLINISKTITNALDVLKRDDINMEEYLSVAHILFEYKNLFDEKDFLIIREFLQTSFKNTEKNITIYYIELFFESVPFLLKNQILTAEVLTNTTNNFYDAAQKISLENGNYTVAALIRENKKWLNIIGNLG